MACCFYFVQNRAVQIIVRSRSLFYTARHTPTAPLELFHHSVNQGGGATSGLAAHPDALAGTPSGLGWARCHIVLLGLFNSIDQVELSTQMASFDFCFWPSHT